jgi:serine/threonine protein kinase
MKPLAQNTLIQNRYLIVHLIGKGGMGEVYLAVDQRLGSAVALKRTFFAGDDMLGNAFEREARTLARMRHPVLPKVSDHFGENDEQYLVMEHISGDDLAKRLEAAGKPFPVSWVLFWADQLLDALSYLHTHEPPIIHRDIKPQNLKLTDENHIILLDFGLSKTSTGQTNISQSGSTGSVVGYTPHYAPMEQIRGIGTSPRSDLYSLSATLYQLLTNTVPVDALSRADSMLNGLPDPIKGPHELNPEVPKVVSDVILRGMEVSQEKRYANAREMQRVLRKAFNDIQQATTASTVAFSGEEAGIVGAVSPEAAAGVNAADSSLVSGASTSVSGHDGTEAPAIEPDPAIDLEATMAYRSFDPNNGGTKQSDVKTEVFNAGINSLPQAGNLEPPSAAGATSFDSAPGFERLEDDSFATPSESGGFVADATVPFIAIDHADVPSAEPPSPADSGSLHGSDIFGADEQRSEPAAEEVEVPYFRSVESEPEVAAAAAPYTASAQPAALPAKKSSGKVIALVGGIAALLLLTVAIGGGIWAYVNYGPSARPEPTPVPSPEETVFATPSPESTVNSNSNLGIGNSNTGASSSANDNSNSGLLVEPTPESTPDREPTPGGVRPTPSRSGQPPRPPRTGPTPKPAPGRTPFRVLP